MNECGLFKQQVIREFRLQMHQKRSITNACLFFLMVMVFFPLIMPAELSLIRTIFPGLLWIAVLFVFLLSTERLFLQDYEDGIIEQWLVSGYPMVIFMGAKLLIQWLANLLPLVLLSPILSLLFSLNGYETSLLILLLCLGSPPLFGLCALATALGGSLKQKEILMALIVLPLALPVMILSSGALTAAMQSLNISGYITLLAAIALLASFLLPFVIAELVRINFVE